MHYEILTRILFIYAKLNNGLKYVQGGKVLLLNLILLQTFF